MHDTDTITTTERVSAGGCATELDSPRPDGPGDRVEELKRQLAAEYEQLIEAAEARLELLDRQIADLTEKRKQTADDLRAHRRDVERLTGERPDTSTGKAAGEFECKVPGCGKSFGTKQGLTMHNTRTHKPDAFQRYADEHREGAA